MKAVFTSTASAAVFIFARYGISLTECRMIRKSSHKNNEIQSFGVSGIYYSTCNKPMYKKTTDIYSLSRVEAKSVDPLEVQSRRSVTRCYQ